MRDIKIVGEKDPFLGLAQAEEILLLAELDLVRLLGRSPGGVAAALDLDIALRQQRLARIRETDLIAGVLDGFIVVVNRVKVDAVEPQRHDGDAMIGIIYIIGRDADVRRDALGVIRR